VQAVELQARPVGEGRDDPATSAPDTVLIELEQQVADVGEVGALHADDHRPVVHMDEQTDGLVAAMVDGVGDQLGDHQGRVLGCRPLDALAGQPPLDLVPDMWEGLVGRIQISPVLHDCGVPTDLAGYTGSVRYITIYRDIQNARHRRQEPVNS
jgi:hypothetical protein